MKKTIRNKALCILLACTLAFACVFPAFAGTPAEDAHLHFNADGRFRILNFSDIQDDETLDDRIKEFIPYAVNTAQPDLIVLTGDNIYGNQLSSASKTQTAIAEFMDIFEELGVPVAIVFGDQDDQSNVLSKEEQMQIYNSYRVSIACDEGSSMDGCGTYNVPIYGSAETNKVKFNLWMFDTGSSLSLDGYDYMRSNQLDWYVARSNALKAENGNVSVPSIAFQHIIVKEIYDALDPATVATPGAVQYNGKYYVLPDSAAPGSVMREHPCPSKYGDEFSVVKQQGDVIAIVNGHDHDNQFVVPHQGIDLINTPGMSFSSYGIDELRGARIIDVDEPTGTYSTEMLYLCDMPYTPAEKAHLRFNADGKFRILNFSDIQDDETLDSRVKEFIRRSVYAADPDLIVLTGDNIYGSDVDSGKTNVAIAQFMDIFEELGVPVAIVFGNHDDNGSALSKENQMKIYSTYSVNISYDEGSSMDGCGTYNVPVFGSTEADKVKFNLWMFDTGSSINSAISYKYDYMRADQLNWYVNKSNKLKTDNGGVPVPSIAFQHIIVNDIYSALKKTSSGTSGAVKYNGNYYVLPDTAKPGSIMREHPCPSGSDSEREFSVVKQQGDVIAIVSGHDHRNMFVVPYQGIDLINSPATGFYSNLVYSGDSDTRGARILDVDEQTGTYSTDMMILRDYTQTQYYSPSNTALNTIPLRDACFRARVHMKKTETVYSAASMAALTDALSQADAILGDLDADNKTTEYDQAALSQAASRVTAALQNLETASFTVTFDANGGAAEEGSRTIVYGTSYGELPNAQREKYLLAGWFTEPEGGEQIEAKTIYTAASDRTLYAHWIEDPAWHQAGDADNNGGVDLRDVTVILRFLAGGWDVQVDVDLADVNNDGRVDLRDVTLLRRYIAGGWGVKLV